MLKTKRILVSLLISIFIVISLYSTSYATSVAVTKEKLEEAFEKYVESEINTANYKIAVDDKVITITSDNVDYSLDYDLTNNPTFTYETEIKQGMSYEDFKNQTDSLTLPMLGYIAVANIQGAEFENASTYFLLAYLSSALNGSDSTTNPYVIYDDTNMSDGVTIDKSESDTNTIYVSEFGERVMEYVNATYKDKQTISDSKSINSFELVIEKKDVTETSCKLVSSLSVNTDADFSQLNEDSDVGINKDITKDNADYVINLKVGQKCNFESSEKITGYEIYGAGHIEISEDKTTITGVKTGDANGYLYVGNNNVKKSVYITVEENTENETLEPITIKLNITPDIEIPKNDTQKTETPNPDTSNTNGTDTNNTKVTDDPTVSKTILPKTGNEITILLFGAFTFCIVFVTILKVKSEKLKDIE